MNETLGAGWFEGVKDWWTHKWLSVRSSLLGVAVGVIPGLGDLLSTGLPMGMRCSQQNVKESSDLVKFEV